MALCDDKSDNEKCFDGDEGMPDAMLAQVSADAMLAKQIDDKWNVSDDESFLTSCLV